MYCPRAMKRRSRIRNVTPHVLLTSALVVSCRDYTCADTADCPIVDAGVSTGVVNVDSRATRAQDTALSSEESANSTSTSPSEGTDTSELAVSLQASDASAASGTDESEGATSSAPEGQRSSGTPGVSHEPDASAWTCDADAGCECEEGETRECWEHPDGSPITDDSADALGDCRLGKQECTNGKWGSCAGAVAPEVEDSCDRPLADDNCNGLPNEGCACIPEETRSCGVDVSPCRAGTQTCGADGQWGAACVGEIPPAEADSCAEEGDDADCNGEPNEGCECVGDEVESCNDCGQRSCNPATGRWGACVPVASSRCNSAGTGIEVCSAQARWQNQACANADAVHCSVACEQAGGAPSCVATAKDVDGDGYRAAACAAAPGDDCDDSTQSVSPGSTELCDGVDNDCDGYSDGLDSTVPLAGVPIHLRGGENLRRADLTWRTSDFFVVADGKNVGDTSDVTHIYGGSTSGSANGLYGIMNLSRIIEGNSDIYYREPRVAYAGGQLGAVIQMNGRSWGTNFVTLNTNGSFATSSSFEGGPPGGGDLTANGSAFALTAHRAPTGVDPAYQFTFAAGGTNGTVSNVTTRTGIAGSVRTQSIAQVGTVTAVVYTDDAGMQPNVNLMRWSNGNVIGPTKLDEPARNGSIASLASGDFAIAWATAAGFRLQVRKTNGTDVVCDSQQVSFGNGTLDALDGVAAAESGLGIVVLATDNSGTMGRADLFVFDQSCELRSQAGKSVFNRSSGSYEYDRPQTPRLAVGQGKLGLAWTADRSNVADTYNAYVRILPDALCE